MSLAEDAAGECEECGVHVGVALVADSESAEDRPALEVFDQRDQLRDVVAVPASQSDRERDAARVDEQVVL